MDEQERTTKRTRPADPADGPPGHIAVSGTPARACRTRLTAAIAAIAAIAGTLVLLLAVVLVVAGWIADSRRARVPDSAVAEISAAVRVVVDVQERNPTDSHYERYLVVASAGSTLQEQRRSVTESLRAAGWEFAPDAPSLAGKDDVGLLLTDTAAVRADDAGLAARLDDRIPPNDRGRPLIVLVLSP